MAAENKLKLQIESYLKKAGIFHWRANVGGRGRIRFNKRGVPDFCCVLPDGRFLGIECKSETGEQTKEQKDFEEELQMKTRALYLLARTLEDVQSEIMRAVRK